MNMHVSLDYTREVKCDRCGSKYIETLYEYIGGPRYWGGRCHCNPGFTDTILEHLKNEINKFEGIIKEKDWNYKIIDSIKEKLDNLVGELGKYGRVNSSEIYGEENIVYYYPRVYPAKKAILNYLEGAEKSFLKEYKGITKEEVFIKEILNINKEDYIEYLSYLIMIRKR